MAPLPSTYAIEAETASLSVRDGQRSLNRWIRRGSVVLVTGDRPRFELQKLLPQHQMSSIVHRLAGGRLNIEANGTRAWFDDVPAIDTRFQPHATRWQAKCNGLEVSLRIGQAADWGAAIELRLCNVTAKDLQSKAVLVLDVRPPAAGEAVPEFRAAVTGQQAVITSGGVDFEAFIQADQGIRLREENGELHLELAAELGPEAAAGGWIVIGQRPAGDAGSPGSPETGSPEALLAESEAYYADRLAKVSCQTPSAALNSALATAVVNMEYLYASPAWLEGVQG